MELRIDIKPLGGDPNTNREQQALLDAVVAAHQISATSNKGNITAQAFMTSLQGSGNLHSAIACGVLSVGGLHAPVAQARALYERATQEDIEALLQSGSRVPGFGHSFYKDTLDPAWGPVMSEIGFNFPDCQKRLEELSGWVNNPERLKLHPRLPMNAALLTGATAAVLKLPYGMETAIFLCARIPTWIDMIPR